MEEGEGGRRLRFISFEEDVKIGSKLRRRTHFFDYQKRRWVEVRQRKDGTQARREEEIPPGMVYDDFITGFYNFRYGAYGKIEGWLSKDLIPMEGMIRDVILYGDVKAALVKKVRS